MLMGGVCKPRQTRQEKKKKEEKQDRSNQRSGCYYINVKSLFGLGGSITFLFFFFGATFGKLRFRDDD